MQTKPPFTVVRGFELHTKSSSASFLTAITARIQVSTATLLDLECSSTGGRRRAIWHYQRRGKEGMTIYCAEGLRGFRIIVTGGGTGGHTYPALTTIHTLRAQLAKVGIEPEILWVGVAHGLEAKTAEREGVPFRAITTGKLRRSPTLRQLANNIADAFRIPVGVLQAIITVIRTRPAVVLSTGGYVSVPIGIAAWLFRRPLVVHEQIHALGLANQILARLATRVLLSHESSINHLPARVRRNAVVTGNPIRPEILTGDPRRGFAAYELDVKVPLVFVTGGAQGAVYVNNLVADILLDVLPYCQVLHQSGEYGLARM